jgi:hypothetical protein
MLSKQAKRRILKNSNQACARFVFIFSVTSNGYNFDGCFAVLGYQLWAFVLGAPDNLAEFGLGVLKGSNFYLLIHCTASNLTGRPVRF